jgi:hypothetical protein
VIEISVGRFFLDPIEAIEFTHAKIKCRINAIQFPPIKSTLGSSNFFFNLIFIRKNMGGPWHKKQKPLHSEEVCGFLS